MYSKEVRQDALFCFEQGCKPLEVTRILCGPSHDVIYRWHKEYLSTGTIKEKRVYESKFTDEQKRAAVEHYLSNGKNQSATVKALGYPSRPLLCQWVDELAPGERRKTKPHGKTNATTLDEKADTVIQAYFSETGKIKAAARESGVESTTFYNWRKKILGEKAQEIVDEITKADEIENADALKEEIAELKAQIRRLKMEKAIWEGAAELVKKDPGVDPANLTNREKTELIDALRSDYSVEELIDALDIPKSSYYYQREAMRRDDKYADLRIRVTEVFHEKNGTFGSLRIWGELRKGDESHEPIVVSEKVVRRIMAEEGLEVIYSKKKRHWSSYGGEISEAPKNLVNRDFHADEPNKLWLTDITEFGLPFGKVYLSPIIDCFDGMVVSWQVSSRPTGKLASDMLEEAVSKLPEDHSLICHSDRGVHYRTHDWIDLCEKYGITRSMSKKGCSPDNSACEGFFGRLKNEFFYYRNWRGIDYETFVSMLDDYIRYYNSRRIKQSLGWLSPMEYRRNLGLAA